MVSVAAWGGHQQHGKECAGKEGNKRYQCCYDARQVPPSFG
jgi:hypothetical protein